MITKSSQTVVTSVTPKNKHIITKYYVIINNNNEIVYVGMTIKTIEQRFKEHCAEKHLDPTQYKIEEIDRIEHSLIETIEDYNREKKKAVDLEQQYIKIALKNGCKLMNKTIGGEWNASYSLFKLYQTKYNKDLDKQWIERLEYWLLNPVPNIVMTKDLLDALKKQFYKGLKH